MNNIEKAIKEQIELAWAAGFFEAEGCVTFARKSRSLSLQIGQCGSPYTLYRFQDAVGIGTIGGPYGPYPNATPKKREVWHWRASGVKGHKVMALLDPYLSKNCIKREKYKRLRSEGLVI